MKHCDKCGQFSGNKKHVCPIKVWNKGLCGVQFAWNKGIPCSEETKQKLSQNSARKGKPAWNKGTKGLQIAWNKGLHINLNPKGSFKKGQNSKEKNINWKGGITSKREQERKRLEMKLWRKSCFERDNFTCAKYEVRTGGLVVHHINNFSEFPKLQTAIDNGITLSKKAHEEFHKKYGFQYNTKGQLDEFLAVI